MDALPRKLDLGASTQNGSKTTFRVWAPKARQVAVRIRTSGALIEERLDREERGYFACTVKGVEGGDLYTYVLDGAIERPDPVSRFQPKGVHGPSMIVDPQSFLWTDEGRKSIGLARYVIYELHVGAFTEAGTFEGVIPHLDYLKNLGVTAVELMPVGQFPGARNWGYDVVYPYAPQNSYGGPAGLKKLVNAAHSKGLSVILDVVYNHLGPEGSYLNDFGYYLTDRYKTPWGAAINFDGPFSDEVRHYFVSNACYWVSEFHIDALRLDAIHGIYDFSAHHFLLELSEAVHRVGQQLGRNVYLIAESDLDDVRVISPPALGGYGIDAQWNDDFHHSIHTLLTGERTGYYMDFGTTEQMVKAVKEGFVYTGGYSPYRKRVHGNSSRKRPAHQFVHFSQNHDQVGNRPQGDRLSGLVSMEALKLAAAATLLAPGIPLLFMGEEYGERAPFQYFVNHQDQTLSEAVRNGRADEFALLGHTGHTPDPSLETTFLCSKIDFGLRRHPGHKEIFAFYQELLRIRRASEALKRPTRKGFDAQTPANGTVVVMTRELKGEAWIVLFNFSSLESGVTLPHLSEMWQRILDSASSLWGGPGEKTPFMLHAPHDNLVLAGHSAVLYKRLTSGREIARRTNSETQTI